MSAQLQTAKAQRMPRILQKTFAIFATWRYKNRVNTNEVDHRNFEPEESCSRKAVEGLKRTLRSYGVGSPPKRSWKSEKL
jgi:hypothetical protein